MGECNMAWGRGFDSRPFPHGETWRVCKTLTKWANRAKWGKTCKNTALKRFNCLRSINNPSKSRFEKFMKSKQINTNIQWKSRQKTLKILANYKNKIRSSSYFSDLSFFIFADCLFGLSSFFFMYVYLNLFLK